MSSSTLIGLMTTGFGLITVAVVVAVLFHFRRRPIVWLLAANERRIAFHRNSVAMLSSALTSAQIEGRRAEFDQLAERYKTHARALLSLDPKATVLPMPAFEAQN
ncbi:hypothetical protein KZX46_16135 [Polymorphobacter sp. PAMC 29334]|uniref:hypothetical protein n=1 Tax=Polymorphobacter sp. PAMC 29334 TaxID=2862331 RepID=UPI001C79154C|nr:hypothetical protein [Polymorphobacter sp. PAMC 29334]QYE34296.1 hypothetical protein KZX46_16135 [Polymorphobacter sp. PAMC 29334]